MGTAISCTECSQMAGLIQKLVVDFSKAPSLCEAVLCAAVLCSNIAIIIVNRHVLLIRKYMYHIIEPLSLCIQLPRVALMGHFVWLMD